MKLKVGGYGVSVRVDGHGLRGVAGWWWRGKFRGGFVRLPIVLRWSGWSYAVRCLGWRRALVQRGFV